MRPLHEDPQQSPNIRRSAIAGSDVLSEMYEIFLPHISGFVVLEIRGV